LATVASIVWGGTPGASSDGRGYLPVQAATPCGETMRTICEPLNVRSGLPRRRDFTTNQVIAADKTRQSVPTVGEWGEQNGRQGTLFIRQRTTPMNRVALVTFAKNPGDFRRRQSTHPGAFLPDHQSTIIIHRSLCCLRYLLFQFFFAQEGAEEAEKKHVAFGKREEFTKSPANILAPSYPIINQQSSFIDLSATSATSCFNSSLHRREQRKQREKRVAFGITWRLRSKHEDFTKTPTNTRTPSSPIIHQQSSIPPLPPLPPVPILLCTGGRRGSRGNQRRHVSTARIPRATPGKLHPKSASLEGLPVAVVPFRQSRGRAFHGEFRPQPLLLGNVSADN
jgi:hypothetical protein